MKKMIIAAFVVAALTVSIALAAGNVSRGKTLFNNPKLAGATSGNSCSTCHPGGKGLEHAGTKKEFHVAGGTQQSLEGAVNACIENAIDGNALDPKSNDMQDLVAYIKSLGSKK